MRVASVSRTIANGEVVRWWQRDLLVATWGGTWAFYVAVATAGGRILWFDLYSTKSQAAVRFIDMTQRVMRGSFRPKGQKK